MFPVRGRRRPAAFHNRNGRKKRNNPPPGLRIHWIGTGDAPGHWCTTPVCNTGGTTLPEDPGELNTVKRQENPSIYRGNPTMKTKHTLASRSQRSWLSRRRGKICGFSVPVGSTPPPIGECPSTFPSIVDGVYGHDCTTGSITVTKVNPLTTSLSAPGLGSSFKG